MKKLLLFICIASFIFCDPVLAQYTALRDTIHPSSHPGRALGSCANVPTQWMSVVMEPSTPTYCLGVTSSHYVDYWITPLPGIVQYRYMHLNLNTFQYFATNWTPVSSLNLIPVDTGCSYNQWIYLINSAGDTCISGEYGFQFVSPDPPYNCLPLSGLNVYPNPLTQPSYLHISFTSAVAGSGTLILTNLQTGQRSTAPYNRILAGNNATQISTLGRPRGTYNIKVTMPRLNYQHQSTMQVLYSSQIIIQ